MAKFDVKIQFVDGSDNLTTIHSDESKDTILNSISYDLNERFTTVIGGRIVASAHVRLISISEMEE